MRRVRASTDLPGTPAAGGAAQHMTGDGPGSDEGSAALEFILVGLVLLVPIVYLIVALGLIQGQSLGVETGARQLARTIAESPDAATADARGKRVLDAIVEGYMEQDLSPREIIAKGYQEADVRRVVRLLKISEYKRRQAPVGIRVTQRGFGKDWRYPITNRYRDPF